MTFGIFRTFNKAILPKKGWRILFQPISFLAQFLWTKFPKNIFTNAVQGYFSRYTWISIQHIFWIVTGNRLWRVGNGFDIKI